MLTTGKPASGPLASMLRKPFSMAGMKFFGMRPPTTLSTKQQFALGFGGFFLGHRAQLAHDVGVLAGAAGLLLVLVS